MQSYFCQSIPVVQNKTFSQLPRQKTFFHAHIQACLDYGSALWDLACVSTLKPLVSLHRRALKLILLKSTSLMDADYKTLCILPLKLRFELTREFLCIKLCFKVRHHILSNYFKSVHHEAWTKYQSQFQELTSSNTASPTQGPFFGTRCLNH